MLKQIIRSYLYTQYNTDADLQALVDSHNDLAQEIYDWLRTTTPPVFVGENTVGSLLTWAVKGIYGQDRPVLVTRREQIVGTFNNLNYNSLAYAAFRQEETVEFPVFDDDLFKRILTWNFYRGDGFNFTVSWFKRRIMRFLLGSNGHDIPNDAHYSISVIFAENEMTISVQKQYRKLSGNVLFGKLVYNTFPYNDTTSTSYEVGNYPYASLFQKAFSSGLLNMPFYLNKATININQES